MAGRTTRKRNTDQETEQTNRKTMAQTEELCKEELCKGGPQKCRGSGSIDGGN